MTQQQQEFIKQLEEAEKHAKMMAEEAARAKHEKEQHDLDLNGKFLKLQEQFAAKEQALKQHEKTLQQQRQQQEATVQQKQAEVQAEAVRIRTEAQNLVNQATRWEQEATAAAATAKNEANHREHEAAATVAAAANAMTDEEMSVLSSSSTVAYHPQTNEPLTKLDVKDLDQEFGNFKNLSHEEVSTWINSMNPQSEQDKIDLLFVQ